MPGGNLVTVISYCKPFMFIKPPLPFFTLRQMGGSWKKENIISLLPAFYSWRSCFSVFQQGSSANPVQTVWSHKALWLLLPDINWVCVSESNAGRVWFSSWLCAPLVLNQMVSKKPFIKKLNMWSFCFRNIVVSTQCSLSMLSWRSWWLSVCSMWHIYVFLWVCEISVFL